MKAIAIDQFWSVSYDEYSALKMIRILCSCLRSLLFHHSRAVGKVWHSIRRFRIQPFPRLEAFSGCGPTRRDALEVAFSKSRVAEAPLIIQV